MMIKEKALCKMWKYLTPMIYIPKIVIKRFVIKNKYCPIWIRKYF